MQLKWNSHFHFVWLTATYSIQCVGAFFLFVSVCALIIKWKCPHKSDENSSLLFQFQRTRYPYRLKIMSKAGKFIEKYSIYIRKICCCVLIFLQLSVWQIFWPRMKFSFHICIFWFERDYIIIYGFWIHVPLNSIPEPLQCLLLPTQRNKRYFRKCRVLFSSSKKIV